MIRCGWVQKHIEKQTLLSQRIKQKNFWKSHFFTNSKQKDAFTTLILIKIFVSDSKIGKTSKTRTKLNF